MGLGLDLEIKNDREHMAIDLTANKEIKSLIEKCLSIKDCMICHKQFDFFVKRFLCVVKGEIICKNCCVRDFYYQNVDSRDKDIIECRCKTCYNFINDTENNLKNAIKSNNLDEISSQYLNIQQNKIEICCKTSKDAERNIDRLEREKKISEHLASLQEVEQYKTIEKSVYVLEKMVKEADDYKIHLDKVVIDRVNSQKSRLLAEKELRKLLSNLTVKESSYSNLSNLEEKLKAGKESNVEEKYLDLGMQLKENIQTNLQANELLEQFCEYPIRIYPVVEVVDPKNKSKS